MKLKLELRFYCHAFNCLQSHKLSSNGVRDTQLGKSDSLNFAGFFNNSESAGQRISYLETQTQCIQRTLRHSDLQPIRDAVLTCTAVHVLKNYQNSIENSKFGLIKLT